MAFKRSAGGIFAPANTVTAQLRAQKSGVPGPLKERWQSDVDSYKNNKFDGIFIYYQGKWTRFEGVCHQFEANEVIADRVGGGQKKNCVYVQAWKPGEPDSFRMGFERCIQVMEEHGIELDWEEIRARIKEV